ncbi:hypothetical protein KFE25_008684 [Diacronema lutheri]|uniref:Protein-tyrosine sulfotransferase n=1 Tax=Diacronema lutheri TaxID=2081491 RepID=A0A8J5XRB2_DIALT|nr:hypothetical protein KFE25_008684 [Diacronema lutheri]
MLSVLLIAATAVRPGAASARAFARLRLDATCHVGPHKTGSTTIQDAILGEWRDSLVEEDGFDIPPRPAVHARRTAHDARRSVAYARAAFALRTAARLGASEPWRWLVEHIRSAAAAGKRLVITAEGLSLLRGSRAGIVPRVLLSAGYAPKVVIVYRRLFERIPSWHSERWLKHAVPVRRYAPIVDWVAANGTRETAPKNLYGQTVALRDVYVALGLEVFVLNMHAIPNGSSLESQFVCEYMRAERTCARMLAAHRERRSGAERKNTNSRNTANLFDVAYSTAASHGMRGRLIPDRFVEALGLALHGRALPMRCVDEPTYAAIWQATAQEEHTLNPAGLDEARVRFAASRPHFCSVDTTKLALDVTLQQRVERAFASATAEA